MIRRYLLLVLTNILVVSSAKLLLVVEVSRHGARTPMDKKFEKDFGINTRYKGQDLTYSGERQHYLLGLKRRK